MRGSEISSSGYLELYVGTTKLGIVSLASAVSTLADAFVLGFTAAGYRAAVDLGSVFLGRADILVSVSLGCLGASMTG